MQTFDAVQGGSMLGGMIIVKQGAAAGLRVLP